LNRLRVYLLITAVYLLWGANFVISKFALREIPGLLAAGLRTSVAGVLLFALHRWTREEGRTPVRREELPRLCTIGTLGVAVNQICFLVGLSLTSAGHAAIVIGLTPFMVLFLAWYRKQESIGWRRVAGLLFAAGGLLLLQKPADGGQAASLLGDLFILGAGASFAIYTVYGKKYASEHGSLAVLSISYVAGTLFLLPITLFFASRFDFSHVTPGAWWSFLYMTLVSSVLCYMGWAYCLKHLAASRISVFSYLQPLVATMLALPLLGEPLTASLVGGGGLIMAGVYLSERG
jgi:drug/metabolite transporter (DMT)-like permease